MPSIVLQTREVATIDYSEVRAAIAGGRATLVVSPLDDGQVVGWPLSDLEVATLEPMQRAFRVDMAAWSTDVGLHRASFDLAEICRQLERTRRLRPERGRGWSTHRWGTGADPP